MRSWKRSVLLGCLAALALVLAYVESFIVWPFGIPGIRLGLPNLVIVFVLYRFGGREAACVSLVRVVAVALLFGNAMAFWYSLGGAALSLGGMVLLRRTKLASATVSAVGGALHSVGQIAVALLVTRTVGVAWYLPVLLVTGVAAGVIIGLAAAWLVRRVPQWNM